MQTHINPSDEESYAQLTGTGKNLHYHPYPEGKRNCKCNGRVKASVTVSNWGIGEKMAKTSNIFCEVVISTLAIAHPQALLDAWIDALQDLWADSEYGYFLVDDSMSTVLQQCQGSTNSFLKSEFISMLSCMQLAIKCQRQVLSLLLLVYLIFLSL